MAPTMRGDAALTTALTYVALMLAAMSVSLSLVVEAIYTSDVALGESDERRIALQIQDVEHEILSAYSHLEIDASADDAQTLPQDASINPTTPNVDGEYEVPEEAILTHLEHDRLLASQLLFPISDDSWCELSLASSVPPGAYALEVSGVVGRFGAHGAGGCPILQGKHHSIYIRLSASIAF
jgi:hypothetical protein